MDKRVDLYRVHEVVNEFIDNHFKDLPFVFDGTADTSFSYISPLRVGDKRLLIYVTFSADGSYELEAVGDRLGYTEEEIGLINDLQRETRLKVFLEGDDNVFTIGEYGKTYASYNAGRMLYYFIHEVKRIMENHEEFAKVAELSFT